MSRLHRVFVSMDSLLDTRIGSIAEYNESIATQLLATGKYQSRRHNQFNLILPYIDTVAVSNAYVNRSVSTLKLSPATPILATLCNLVTDYRVNKEISPEVTEIQITLNSWPYVLTTEESDDFALSIKEATGADKVNVRRLPITSLTPEFVGQYDTFVWHELDDWVSTHMKNIHYKGMHNTTFYCPEIITHHLHDLDKIPKDGPGQELRIMMAEYVIFELMPLSMYSLYPPE